jgi:hypothetical protein
MADGNANGTGNKDGTPAKKVKRAKKPKDPNAPKKPLTAFMLFTNWRRPQVLKENPCKPPTPNMFTNNQ